MFLATINVPGYLPMDDDPPVFETAQEAWEYLLGERREAEDWDESAEEYSDTFDELRRRASEKWLVADFERAGVVYGDTPGYDGTHDLGLAYSVTEIERIDCPVCGNSGTVVDFLDTHTCQER